MQKFNLTFYVKKDKINSLGQVPIYARIMAEGTKTTFSTFKWIDGKRWGETKQLKITRNPEEIRLLDKLDEIRKKIEVKFNEILVSEVELTAENLKNAFLEKKTFSKAVTKTFMEAFDFHNKKFTAQINAGERAKASLTKFKTTQTHLRAFMKEYYKKDDLVLDMLNFEFIDNFDLFLRNEKGIKNNTTVKYCQAATKITNLAIKYDWLNKNPFAKYEGKLKVEDAVFLTEEELELIENKVFNCERLNIIKDIFLFSCYTGYAPCDVKKLNWDNVVKNVNGEYWIYTNRQKTDTKSNVPLLPKALRIIEKYKNVKECIIGNPNCETLSGADKNQLT